MGLVTLLNMSDPAIGFENAQSHQLVAPPWSVIDPGQLVNSGWREDHQVAHDALLPGGENFEDIDPTDPEARAWWTWTHHQEHQQAQATAALHSSSRR